MALKDYKELVGSCAMLTTMAHMLTGTVMCKDFYKQGTSKGFDPMPFIGGIAMCTLNLQYGLIVNDPLMINVNLFGIATNVVYMLVFYCYTPDKAKTLATLGKATVFVAVILGYTFLEKEEHLEYRYGIITTVLLLLLIASPLAHLKDIIRTKSTEVLPFPLIFMGALVQTQWLVYGLIIDDSFIIFQNAVCVTLSAAQLALFVIYPSKPADRTEKPKSVKKEN